MPSLITTRRFNTLIIAETALLADLAVRLDLIGYQRAATYMASRTVAKRMVCLSNCELEQPRCPALSTTVCYGAFLFALLSKTYIHIVPQRIHSHSFPPWVSTRPQVDVTRTVQHVGCTYSRNWPLKPPKKNSVCYIEKKTSEHKLLP